uniref:Thymidylate kinase n=1 Tax=Culicoides sonorensis TaxID=179676 RepID=A0A336L6X4_CULSO
MTLRGALIVFEGCDRAGKTTQAKLLVEKLKKIGHDALYMNFPNRKSDSGKLIDAYLQSKRNFTDQGIHLLFSLNRWEAKQEMEDLLLNGTTLIVDRYSYSGVAFSAAKGLDFQFCKGPEAGLIKPDLVMYLNLTTEELQKRGGFGNERYEIPVFQKRVGEIYQQLFDQKYWKEIDAGVSEEKLHSKLTELAVNTIQSIQNKPLTHLW